MVKLEGKALGIVQLVGKGEGLEAWRKSGNRQAALLRGILNPRAAWEADTRDGRSESRGPTYLEAQRTARQRADLRTQVHRAAACGPCEGGEREKVISLVTEHGVPFITCWRSGKTVKNLSRSRKISGHLWSKKVEERKHRTEWCAAASKHRCMRCGRMKKQQKDKSARTM